MGGVGASYLHGMGVLGGKHEKTPFLSCHGDERSSAIAVEGFCSDYFRSFGFLVVGSSREFVVRGFVDGPWVK